MNKIIIIVLVAFILGAGTFLFIQHEPRIGKKAMVVLDDLRVQTDKLDSLVKNKASKKEIARQTIIVYKLMKKRVSEEKSGLKLVKQEYKDFIKKAEPYIKELEKENPGILDE